MGELIPNTTTKFILSAALILLVTLAMGALFSNSFLPWIKGFITEWNPFRPAEGWELTIVSDTDFTEPLPDWVIEEYLKETFEEVVQVVATEKNNIFILNSLDPYVFEGHDEIKVSMVNLLEKVRTHLSKEKYTWKDLNNQEKLDLKENLFLWGVLNYFPAEQREQGYSSTNFIYFRNVLINQKIFKTITSDYIQRIFLSQGTELYKQIYPSFTGTYEEVYSEFVLSGTSGTQFYCPLWNDGKKSLTGGICEGSRVKANTIKLVAQGGLKSGDALFMFWTDEEGNSICTEDKEKLIQPQDSCTIKMNGDKKIHVKAAPLGLLEK